MIDVTVYYSGFDCLKVSIVGDNTFNLSAEGAQKSSKISIQNTCAEPVRILEASSRSQELMFGIPTITVSPGENAHTYLSVFSVRDSLKLENYPVTLRGVTSMSQTPIEAKPIQINVFAGVNFNDEYSKATKGVKAKTCDEQEVTIDVPKSSSDCSNGYCDAQQASEYLAKKLDLTIRKAKSQAAAAQKETESLACVTQGYCTFGSLGVPTESVKIYLKNDAITAETMKAAFGGITSGSTGFREGLGQNDYIFEETVISEETMEMLARSPYGRHVFIDNQLKGCGYYEIIINGAFPVSGTGVTFDAPTITMQARTSLGGPRVQTKECKDSLENLSNFVPEDKGYSLGDTKGSWLTSIDSEQKLEPIAKAISTKLFGDEARVGQANGNRIVLKEGALTGALAEVCLTGGTKKTIEITVTSTIDSMNETTRKAFEGQVAKMFAETVKGNFGTNCLVKGSDGYTCVQLKDTTGLGGMKMVIPNKKLILNHKEGCVEGEVSSDFPEPINFELSLDETKKKFNGVTSIVVYDIDKKEKYFEKDFVQGKIIVDETVELEVIADRKKSKFSRGIVICAYPGELKGEASEHAYITANGAEFIIQAINKSAGLARGTEEEEGKIIISTGRLHPDDLITYLAEKPATFKNKIGEANPYYFTITWQDSSDTIYDFGEYYRQFSELGKGANHLVYNDDGSLKVNERTSATVDTARRAGMNSYFKWCAGTSAVCNLGTGGLNTVLGVVFDCGIPAITVMKDDLVKAYPFFESIYDTLDEIPWIGKMFEIKEPSIETMDWTPKNTSTLIAGGVGGLTTRTLTNTMKTFSGLSKNNRAGITRWARSTFEKEVQTAATSAISTANPSLGKGSVSRIAKAYTKQFGDTFKLNLDAEFKDALAKTKLRENALIADFKNVKNKELLEAIGKAKSSADPGLQTFLAQRSGATASSGEPLTWLDELVENGTNGNPYKANLTPDDLVAKGLRGKIGSLVNSSPGLTSQLDGIVSNSVDSKIMTETIGGVGNQISITRLNGAELDGIVDDVISEMTQGKAALTGTKRVQVRTEIMNKLKNKFTSAGKYDDVAKTFTSNVDGDSLKLFMKESANDIFTDSRFSDVLKYTDDQLNNIAKGMKGMTDDVLGSSLDDVAKNRGFFTKAKSLFNTRFLTSIGRGIGCGIAANYMGVKKYKESVNEHFKDQQKEAKYLGGKGTIFNKGETYKMVLKKNNEGKLEPLYYPVLGGSDLEKEMLEALSPDAEGVVRGTYLIWTTKISSQPPEKRKLVDYLLQVEISNLIDSLSDDSKFLKDKKDTLEAIQKKLEQTDVQRLIYMYTHQNGQVRQKYKFNGGDYPVPEAWAGALLVSFKDSMTNEMIASELKGETSFLKDKIKLFIDEVTAGKEIQLTPELAEKIAPGNGEILHDVTGAWEELIDKGKSIIA
jgi:hypothetical protein